MRDEHLDILVAHGDEGTLSILVSTLESLSHRVVARVTTGKELVAEARQRDPDLIISNVELRDMDGIEALIEASRHDPKPSVIVAKKEHMDKVEKALEDHVMAYLVEPVTEDDLRPTIYLVRRRFEQFQELKDKVDTLEEALEARKTVEKAKGIVMRTKGLDEESAYQFLRKLSNDRRKKIAEVAEAVLLAEQIAV